MRHIYKIANIALIFMLIGVVLCAETGYALRVPITQEYGQLKKVMTKIEEVYIRVIEPSEYTKYRNILDKITDEDKEGSDEFSIIRGKVKNKSSTILALFVVQDINGEILSAKLVYKLKKIEGLDLEAVTGIVAVRNNYQRKGIGIELRKAVFEWLIDKGYDRYVAQIRRGNKASRNNLRKVCEDLGLVLNPQPAFVDKRGITRHYYLVDLVSKTEIDLIRDRAKKLILAFLRHKFAHIVTGFTSRYSLLARLLEPLDEQNLRDLCLEDGEHWYHWHRNNLTKLVKSRRTDFDIEDILRQIKNKTTTSKRVIVKLENALEEGIFKGKKRETIGHIKEIKEQIKKALVLIESIPFLSTTDNINKLIEYYGTKMETSGTGVDLKLSDEDLIFEKIVEDESLIILGIIDNLIVNAWEIDSRVYKGIKTTKEDKWLKIEVSDAASGIPKENLPLIFDEGFTTRELEEGQKGGQGLYLTLEYLKLKGGKIQVDTKREGEKAWKLTFDDKLEKSKISESSRTKKGTTFTIWLPLSQKSPEKPRLAGKPKAISMLKILEANAKDVAKAMQDLENPPIGETNFIFKFEGPVYDQRDGARHIIFKYKASKRDIIYVNIDEYPVIGDVDKSRRLFDLAVDFKGKKLKLVEFIYEMLKEKGALQELDRGSAMQQISDILRQIESNTSIREVKKSVFKVVKEESEMIDLVIKKTKETPFGYRPGDAGVMRLRKVYKGKPVIRLHRHPADDSKTVLLPSDTDIINLLCKYELNEIVPIVVLCGSDGVYRAALYTPKDREVFLEKWVDDPRGGGERRHSFPQREYRDLGETGSYEEIKTFLENYFYITEFRFTNKGDFEAEEVDPSALELRRKNINTFL